MTGRRTLKRETVRPFGDRGEDLARAFLEGKGYEIVCRNYRTHLGEIDLIARDGAVLVFVEVKTRRHDLFGQPFEAVGPRKRGKLARVALHFMKQKCLSAPARFDVVSIIERAGDAEITHITDAFSL